MTAQQYTGRAETVVPRRRYGSTVGQNQSVYGTAHRGAALRAENAGTLPGGPGQ
ncbi:hypothetical protein [Streptomyces sp. NPDC085937]|uniref:hypothetical protein n=1 Tax=Streptomyces sp. NPDC085937 TaxID=3365742 RepID=UPI0037CDFE05